MAGNDLSNASGLDGTTGWATTAGSVSVDETTLGGPGRGVLQAGAFGLSVGATLVLSSTGVAVVAGAMVEIAGLYSGNASTELALAIYSGSTLLSRTVIAPVRTSTQTPRLGVPSRMAFAYGLLAAPATGTAKLEVKTTSAGGATNVYLSKPYLDAAWDDRRGYVWDPGVTANADLTSLRRWPSTLPPVLLEGYSTKATAIRQGWSSDSDIEATTRMAGSSRCKLQGQMRLTLENYADLVDFCEASDDQFLFVRPDTQQLCLAQWLKDGQPDGAPIGTGDFMVTVGLQLEVL